MRIPMTFQELLEIKTEDEVFPLEIDDTLRDTIINWFKYRRLCVIQPERFILYFQRVLLEHYLRYRELLRIEPGISQFDWLVETYREMQNSRLATISDEELSELEKTTSLSESGTNGNTRTFNDTVNGTSSNTRTNNLTETHNLSKAETGTDQKTKTNTRTNNLTDTRTIDEDSTRTDDLTDTTTYTNLKDETAFGRKQRTTHDGDDTTIYGTTHDELSKSAPMSIAYQNNPVSTQNIISGGTSSGSMIGNLDYHYADVQGTSNDKSEQRVEYDSSDTVEDLTGSKETRTRTGSEETSKEGDVTFEKDVTDTLKKTGTIGDSGSESFIHGKTTADTGTIGHTGTVGDSGTNSTAHTGTIADSGTNSKTGSGSEDSSTTRTATQDIDDVIRERLTGRNTDIAMLLRRAREYIEVTDAWMWLRKELEPCFYGTYLEEDDDE